MWLSKGFKDPHTESFLTMVRKEVFIGRGKMISANLENEEQSLEWGSWEWGQRCKHFRLQSQTLFRGALHFLFLFIWSKNPLIFHLATEIVAKNDTAISKEHPKLQHLEWCAPHATQLSLALRSYLKWKWTFREQHLVQGDEFARIVNPQLLRWHHMTLTFCPFNSTSVW